MRLRAVVSGVERIFEVPIQALSDMQGPLKRAGQRLRDEAKETFAKGQGRGGGAWAPLAGSTKERLEQTTAGPVNVRGQVRAAYLDKALWGLRQQAKAGKATYLAVEELKRLSGGGNVAESLEASLPDSLKSRAVERLRRKLSKTQEQRRKGQRLSKKHRLLGKLAGGLRLAVKKGSIVVDHIVEWAGVHNEGGQVGHGASVSARTFLELLERDLTALIEDIFASLEGTE